jgi:hypothetical protein
MRDAIPLPTGHERRSGDEAGDDTQAVEERVSAHFFAPFLAMGVNRVSIGDPEPPLIPLKGQLV